MDTFINQPASTEEITPWRLPSSRKVGMILLIMSETALFTIFVIAYLWYYGKSLNPPYPRDILHVPIWASLALFGSSATIMVAEHFLKKGSAVMFNVWWGITIALGVYFMGFTAWEWHHFIYDKDFTIATNVFGSTFYSLVGLHASHVIVGLILLAIVLISSLRGKLDHGHHEHVEMISWYWHFVDAVWVVVLSIVYLMPLVF